MNAQKTILSLAMLLLILASCERPGQIDLEGQSTGAQMDIKPSTGKNDDVPCECSAGFYMTSSHSNAYDVTQTTEYDFAVMVSKTSDCDPNLCWGTVCGNAFGKFTLQVTNLHEFGLGLDAFEEIKIRNGNIISSPYQLNSNSNNIVASIEGGEVLFKWKENLQVPHPGAHELQFSSGGICIIDIITDPNGGGNNGGSGPATGVK